MELDKNPLSSIPVVQLSQQGIFKYILIQASVRNKDQSQHVTFVRGNDQKQYHADNFRDFIYQVQKSGFKIADQNVDKGRFIGEKGQWKIKFTCPGGGRIEHNYKGKKCHIYGYSKSYGRVDHMIAKGLIQEHLKYSEGEITTSQEGY